ncbi:MarR family winged helix-turn-helix transcriptional regulator [Glaciibacter superstes]|uniref:MarR family winged helix-turn-helix transcriptional regulator n=1 Tax=Glaciibacter superstes TaxID=501023 RepID=UPI0003B36CE1|nr:MarR family winged helix-turn-helix transcriptional regulator [Glaciibacter superstes]
MTQRRETQRRENGTDSDGEAQSQTSRAVVRQPTTAAGGPISHAIFRVARLHRMLAGSMLRRTGLYPGQELVMMHLWDRGEQRQSDLAKFLDSDAATITRTIQRLERAGFVRRRPDPSDARASLIEPTPASSHLRTEIDEIWQELERLTVGLLDPAQQEATLAAFEALERNLVTATAER